MTVFNIQETRSSSLATSKNWKSHYCLLEKNAFSLSYIFSLFLHSEHEPMFMKGSVIIFHS